MGELLFLDSGVGTKKEGDGTGRKEGGREGGRGMVTEERDAGRVGEVQSIAVFAEILTADHQAAERLKDGHGAGIDLSPGAAEAMDRCGAEGGDDGCEGREIVHGAAFLSQDQ